MLKRNYVWRYYIKVGDTYSNHWALKRLMPNVVMTFGEAKILYNIR
jgi:hypothetical protein